MKPTLKAMAAALLTAAVASIAPAPANAAEALTVCPSGRTAVFDDGACQFADNVRHNYLVHFTRVGSTLYAYMTSTGRLYLMDCPGGFAPRQINGVTVNAIRCSGEGPTVYIWA